MSAYTKDCPQCGTEHKLRVMKCGCGYKWTDSQEKTVERDPMHGCCSYTTGTSRCHYPGTFSDSLNGGGRWFCSAHDRETDPTMGAAIVHKSHEEYPNPDWSLNAVRRRYELKTIKAMADSKTRPATRFQPSKPGKDWAHRIMERERNGETLPLLAVEFAKEATGA